jgi:hypothetical protein
MVRGGDRGMVYLGSLKVSRQGTRFYVVLPPVPVVRNLAGTRRLDFSVVPHIPPSCKGGDSLPVDVISFSAKISIVKRRDGLAWYKLNLPARFNDVWKAVYECDGRLVTTMIV